MDSKDDSDNSAPTCIPYHRPRVILDTSGIPSGVCGSLFRVVSLANRLLDRAEAEEPEPPSPCPSLG